MRPLDRAQATLTAAALIALSLSGCGDDKTVSDFECECPSGQVCRNNVCVDADAGLDAGGDVRDEFIDNPDCPGAGIVINELVPRPATGQPDWVELKGPNGRDLTGFRLVGINGAGGSEIMNIVLDGAIGGDGRFLVAGASIGGVDQVDEDLDMQTGPDSLRLVDCGGQVIDAVGYGNFTGDQIFAGEANPAPAPGQGGSIGRCPAATDTNDNSVDFHLVTQPTPGQENANFTDPFACEACVGGLFDGQVVISEVLYDPDGSDTVNNEFVELRGTPGLDLFGLRVEWVNGNDREAYMSLDLDGVIGQDGLFVIGGSAPDAELPGTMQNGPDGIRLVDCEGSEVDSLGYGDFGTDQPLGEGSAAPSPGSGSSLARCADGGDTDNNAVDFYPATPTPGAPNSSFEDLLACGGTGCAAGLLTGRLLINEVVPGEGGFIELFGDANIGLANITLQILDGAGTAVETLELEGMTTPQGFFTADTDNLPAAGGTVRLLDCEGVEVDAVAWGAGGGLAGEGAAATAPGAGQGLARCPGDTDTNDNASDFQLVDNVTPGDTNAGFVDTEACAAFECTSGLLSGNVVINELAYRPGGTDSQNLTFIELRGVPGTVVEQATLVTRDRTDGDIGRTLTLVGEIPTDGLLVAGQNPSDTSFAPDILTNFADLTNTGAGVDLVDCEGVLVDAVAYGEVAATIGEGTVHAGVADDQSLARCATANLGDADSGDNATDFHAASPTPGNPNVGIGPACGEPACDATALDGKVVINEVRPGTGGFIELFGTAALNLQGATLRALAADGSEVASFALTDSNVLDGSGFFTVTTDALSAAGGSVRLIDCALGAVDAVAWGAGGGLQGEGAPATAPGGDEAIGRCVGVDDTGDNAADFKVTTMPTSGAENEGFAEGACPVCIDLTSRVVINELNPDEAGNDSTGNTSFVELRSSEQVVLDGAELRFINATNSAITTTVLAGQTIDGLFLIGEGGVVTDAEPANRQLDEGLDVLNGPDTLQLWDACGNLVDAVAFDGSGGGTDLRGEGDIAVDVGDTQTLGRLPTETFADADHNANRTDFCVVTLTGGQTSNAGVANLPESDDQVVCPDPL